MTEVTVLTDLQMLLDLTPRPQETQQEFTFRLVEAASALDDTDWETLDQATQEWVNSAVAAVEQEKTKEAKIAAMPLPDGIETLIPATVEEPEAEVLAEDETEMSLQTSTSTAKGARGRKIVVAKPVVAKPAKVAKPKKATAQARPGPKGKFPADAKIKLLVKENPFHEGSKCHGWFGSIENGMTVAKAVEAGAPRHHIRWACALGHLKIG